MSPQSKILMVCYHYSPANTGGVQRSLKFADFLPEYGWTPIVLTTNISGEAPGIYGERIERTSELHAIYRRLGGKAIGVTLETTSPPSLPTKSIKRRLLRLLYATYRWFLFPDHAIGWIGFAFPSALRLIRREEIDVIYTTSPPASSHLLGRLLKLLIRKPWIMDLRDPWTIEPLSAHLRKRGYRSKVEKWLEQTCFKAADTIVLNTPEALALYQERFPHYAPKMQAITNGYDQEALNYAATTLDRLTLPSDSKYIISHVGTFSRYHDPGDDPTPYSLLNAIGQLQQDGILEELSCRFVFAGTIHSKTLEEIHKLGLNNVVLQVGLLSHIDAVRLMLQSDVLLLVDINETGASYISGKLYEYLASGKPVVGIVGDGANRNLLNKAGQFVAAPHDVDGIRLGLVQGLATASAKSFKADWLDAYEYRELTRKLATCLDRLCVPAK